MMPAMARPPMAFLEAPAVMGGTGSVPLPGRTVSVGIAVGSGVPVGDSVGVSVAVGVHFSAGSVKLGSA